MGASVTERGSESAEAAGTGDSDTLARSGQASLGRGGSRDESSRDALKYDVFVCPKCGLTRAIPTAVSEVRCGCEYVEMERQSLSLRVTEDRVLIKADREDHAPTQTEAGIYLASSLAAAVDGSDEEDSWFVGTIVQLGPLVNRFDVRPAILRGLWDAETEGIGLSPLEVRELITRVQEVPKETPEPF